MNEDWPTTLEEAQEVQQQLRGQVVVENRFDRLETVAGVDVSYDLATNLTHAFVVTMRLGELKVLKTVTASLPTGMPYVPGFLSFREVPAILAAMAKLPQRPDLLMVDGQGIAHPRRFGIACHLGVLLDLPSIGVAKSRLVGRHEALPQERGSAVPLLDRSEIIGTVLRSKQGCNPLYISPGHRIDVPTATRLVTESLTTYRLPEPTDCRQAVETARPGSWRHAPLIVFLLGVILLSAKRQQEQVIHGSRATLLDRTYPDLSGQLPGAAVRRCQARAAHGLAPDPCADWRART